VNEGEPKRGAVYWAVIIGGVLIAAAIIALYTPWLYLFDLREIVVLGNHHLSAEEIRRVAGFSRGENLLRTPIHRATDALLGLPWVKGVSIKRLYPHTIEIVVRERTPIAVIPGSLAASSLVLAEGGVVVQTVKDADSLPFTVFGAALTGEAPGAQLVDRRMSRVLDYLHQKGLSAGIFQRIDFSDPAAVVLYGEGGVTVTLGPLDGIERRIDELVALIDAIDIADYRTIDLRFGGEAILVPR
jgi:cell division protein FtsQ